MAWQRNTPLRRLGQERISANDPSSAIRVAAAGDAQAHPSVRWDELSGRRSHTSKTPWALGFIPTVRIGAGAWRKQANTRESGDTDQAGTNLHNASQGMQEQKGKREEAFKNGKSMDRPGKKPVRPFIENLIAIARASAPLRCAPRGQLLQKEGT